SVYTVFASGALALWGSAYLLYIFARKRNFPQPYAAAFGIIWLLIPGVTNLNFSIFYGVNAIVFFIPVFFGFYMLYESKRYFWVFTVFLFSLTLKETVGVFWLGWGAVSFLEKRRRDGILYGSIGLIWFLLCIKVFIPYFAGHDYIFYGQFDQSGGGIIDIILSPFTRPAEFWGQVLRVKNLQFLLLLLLPFFPGALNRPWLLGAGALLLGFNFIRNSEEIVNLAQQYQVENIAMFAVALVLGVRRVKPGNRLPRLLSWRLTAPKLKNTRMAMIAGTMACALFSHYFFAETFYNKANLMRIINLADVRDAVDEMKTLIPPGETLDADLFVAPMFLFRNPLYGVDHKAEKFLAYHVVDSVMSFPFARHGEILRDPDWEQIWHKSLDDGRVLFLFRRVETPAKVGQKSPLPPKRNSTEPATTTPQISHYFDIAIHPDKTGSKIEFRLRRPLRGFARIYLRIIFPDNTTTQRNFFFADAALAPEQMPVGSKYELALPWSAEEISSAKLQFILRIL
ncbi:MAG: DUF2079 domain-containing protein, partial [Victivallales bacterium]|nr:DUF2079 domain-containing protein [Victivallales bacterium]